MSNNILIRPQGRGRAFVLSGPAGVGKTTLVSMLCHEFNIVHESISCTTRPPRENEVDGRHYRFISQEKFDALAAKDEFLEHVRLFDCAYGTPRTPLIHELEKGHHVILVIDTQGALLVKERFPATLIFVAPPSIEALQERLETRETETSESLGKRLNRAKEELKEAHHYDYQIINDELQSTYQVLRSIIIAEAHRISKE